MWVSEQKINKKSNAFQMLAMIFKSSEKNPNIFGSGFNKIDSYKSKENVQNDCMLKL